MTRHSLSVLLFLLGMVGLTCAVNLDGMRRRVFLPLPLMNPQAPPLAAAPAAPLITYIDLPQSVDPSPAQSAPGAVPTATTQSTSTSASVTPPVIKDRDAFLSSLASRAPTAQLCNGLPCAQLLKRPGEYAVDKGSFRPPPPPAPSAASEPRVGIPFLGEEPLGKGPLGRPNIPGQEAAVIMGPFDKAIGRARGGDALKVSEYAFVKKLNNSGHSPLGRISKDYVEKIFPPKRNESLEHEPEYTIITGRGPVGRLPPPLPKLKPRKKQDLKPKPKPPENVKWLSGQAFQRLLDEQKKKEPKPTSNDNGFSHSNDLDITNIAYSQKTRVLPVYKEGREFNLNNALNHPERLMQHVTDWDKLAKKAALKKLALQHGMSPDPKINAYFKNLTNGHPIIVDQLPGNDGVKSRITGTDKIISGFESWFHKWNKTAQMGRQALGPLEERMIDDLQKEWEKKYNKSERVRCGCIDQEHTNQTNSTCECGWQTLPKGQKLIPETEKVRRADAKKAAMIKKALDAMKAAEKREFDKNHRLQKPSKHHDGEHSGSSSSSYSSSSSSSSGSSSSSHGGSQGNGHGKHYDASAALSKLNSVASRAEAHLSKLEKRRKEIMDSVFAIKSKMSAVGRRHILKRISSKYDENQTPEAIAAQPKITAKHAAIAAKLHKTLAEQLTLMAQDEKRMQEQIFKTRLQLATLHHPVLKHIKNHMDTEYEDFDNWGSAVYLKRQGSGSPGSSGWKSKHEAIHERIRNDYGGRPKRATQSDQ